MVVSIILRAIMLIGSNLLFLLPSIVAWRDTMFYEAAVYFGMFAISSLYHVVDVFANVHMGLSYGVWQKLDFYFAFCMISRTTFMVIFNTGTSCATPEEKIRNLQIKQVANVFLDTVCLALVLQNVETPLFVLLLAVLCIVASVVAACMYPANIKLDFTDLILGWVFIACGVVFYVTCGSCAQYWFFHSVWHGLVSIGVFLQIESRNKAWTCLDCMGRYVLAPCGCYVCKCSHRQVADQQANRPIDH